MSKIRQYGIDPTGTMSALDRALNDALSKDGSGPGFTTATTAALYASPSTVAAPSPGECRIESCGGTMTMAYIRDAQAVLPYCPNCSNVDLGPTRDR